jgi:hypothetical protein
MTRFIERATIAKLDGSLIKLLKASDQEIHLKLQVDYLFERK